MMILILFDDLDETVRDDDDEDDGDDGVRRIYLRRIYL